MRRILERGTSAVELAIILPLFRSIVLGRVDFGRAIVMYNALSEAAREGARKGITLVTYDDAAASPDTTLKTVTGSDATAIQDAALYHTRIFTDTLTVSSETAIDSVAGATLGGYVRVRVTATFTPLAGPLLGGMGNIPLGATSKMYLP